jgi:hypothetical protein
VTHETYRAIGLLIGCAVALQTFFGCWIWCIASVDKHLGFSSGWLPSATAGFFAFFLARSHWPFFAIAMMLGALFLVAIVVVPPVASWSWLRARSHAPKSVEPTIANRDRHRGEHEDHIQRQRAALLTLALTCGDRASRNGQ